MAAAKTELPDGRTGAPNMCGNFLSGDTGTPVCGRRKLQRWHPPRKRRKKKKMTSNVFSIKMAPARKGKDKSWQPLALVRQKEQEIGTASVLGESPHGFLPLGPTF